MNHRGRPDGYVRTHRTHFTTPPEPVPGDVVETFSGMQWRILAVRFATTHYQVTEVKLAPAEYVQHPEWKLTLGR